MPVANPRCSARVMSTLLVTVMVQAKPWLMPRKRLAATIHHQFGAKSIRKRNRQGRQPAHHQHRLAPDALGQPTGDEIEHAFDQPERDDETHQEQERRLGHAEILLRHHRQHRALHAHDQSDQGHLHGLPDELVQVDADALPVQGIAVAKDCGGLAETSGMAVQGVAASCASGRPAACHSATPSAILLARNPRCTSSFTAASDITQNGPRQ